MLIIKLLIIAAGMYYFWNGVVTPAVKKKLRLLHGLQV